jgi:hypothetical protein
MPQMTEAAAENLTPEQATAAVRVLDLQAGWDALLEDKGSDHASLRIRQKAHDAYQLALREYEGPRRDAPLPEPTHSVPDRLAAWCRVLKAVFLRATGEPPEQLVGKVYRLADRIAARVGDEPLVRPEVGSLADAVRAMDAVIAWCHKAPLPKAP